MSEKIQEIKAATHLREKPLFFSFAVQREYPNKEIRILIRWKRCFLALLLLSIIGWTALTSTLYFILKYKQNIETVTLTNALLLQRSEIRRKIGDYNIQESTKTSNYRDATRLWHFGVARSPGNLKGRRLIAEDYELIRKRPAIAADYLIEGLKHGGLEDAEYVKRLIQVLLRNQMDEKIQEIADTYLPKEPQLTEINRLLALGAASAYYHRGGFDLAEDYLINYNLMELVDGLLISSRISWDRGNRTAAIVKLEQTLNRFPKSDLLLAQLSTYYRETGDMDKARRFALLRNIENSSSHRPKLALLYLYEQTADNERLETEIERMFEQFGTDKDALTEFSNFAAKTGNVSLAKRIQQHALENEFDVGVFALLFLEAHIFNRDYVQALNLMEGLVEEKAEWLTKYWSVFNGLRSIAAFETKRPDLGEVYLQNFLKETRQTPYNYLNLANQFFTTERLSQAREVLTVAYRQFPKNQKILAELIKVELDLGNTEKLSELLNRLLKMRRPSVDLLTKAYQKLSSDRFIFTQNRSTLLLQIRAILRENDKSQSLLETSL